ncbi:MAG: Uncharacterised protein [Opitutia bacterium UBA7350]|nr:MAG: Uncharacterised protein [Opitutae bacterium UBA7350]
MFIKSAHLTTFFFYSVKIQSFLIDFYKSVSSIKKSLGVTWYKSEIAICASTEQSL